MQADKSNSVDAVDQSFIELFEASQNAHLDSRKSTHLLESKLDGPAGVVQALLERVWLEASTSPPSIDSPAPVQGEHAVAVLSHLVENYSTGYMSITSQLVRQDIERRFSSPMDNDEVIAVSDALLAALTKLLIAPNSDDQTRIATDVNAALLCLCKYDHCKYNKGRVAQRLFATLLIMWRHIQQNASRELSSGQIRIASVLIDVALLGDEEFSYATLDEGGECILDILLHLALDMPNDDPLLQMSALDQLERLAAEPVQKIRLEFLLGNDLLRNGLLYLVGGNEDEMDAVNGPAALRLITEICRVGVSSSLVFSIEESVLGKFQVLLKGFHAALHRFHPQGELERLSFIYAVSSLFASCSVMACSPSTESTVSTSELTSFILRDKTLLHDWLSLHSRVAQPKLKSAVLCSIAQVLEPSSWNDESVNAQQKNSSDEQTNARPNDAIALQLHQAFSDANGSRDATDLLLASAKSPFVEERLGAYCLFKTLVMRGATLQLLLLHKDETGNISVLVWLLDHHNESTTEGRLAKYQIVDTMMSCSGTLIRGLIPDKMARELQLWIEKGPAYTKSIPWEMATE